MTVQVQQRELLQSWYPEPPSFKSSALKAPSQPTVKINLDSNSSAWEAFYNPPKHHKKQGAVLVDSTGEVLPASTFVGASLKRQIKTADQIKLKTTAPARPSQSPSKTRASGKQRIAARIIYIANYFEEFFYWFE